MILQNLLNNPSSDTRDKHRKLNTSSPRFQELLSDKGAPAELLKLAGFEYQRPNFTFGTEQPTEAAQRVLELLQEAQRNLDHSWASSRASAGAAGS
ncbi:unnamed protein product, partial [Prorocentrum cordatum]